jgi:gas vesicle protein
MSEMSKKGNSILFGFLAGAAVGAILGILYAPDKGSNTREKLSSRLDKYKTMLEEFIAQMMAGKEQTNATPGQPVSTVNKVVTEAQEKAERLLEDVDELLAQLRENKKN